MGDVSREMETLTKGNARNSKHCNRNEECPLIVSSLKITEKKFDELKIHQIETYNTENWGGEACKH